MLKVIDRGMVVHRIPLTDRPVTLGRAAGNDLILNHSSVSSHHAMVFRQGDAVWFRDLGSTNGVMLNGTAAVEGQLRTGDTLQIGDVQIVYQPSSTVSPASLQFKLADSGVAWPVESGFQFADQPDYTVFREDGGVQLQGPDAVIDLTVDEHFELGGRAYQLVQSPLLEATVPAGSVLPYHLQVDLSGERATLSGAQHAPVELRSSNRVALLYLLATHHSHWLDDATLGSGVWGRAWMRQDPNNLNVLLHRVRAQAAKGGYDRRFIERKRGAMRLCVATTDVTDQAR